MHWDPVSPSDLVSTPSVPPSIHGHDPQRSSIDDQDSRNLTPASKEGDASPRPAKKRKASTESADSAMRPGSRDGKPISAQNKSHSIVEKRYRTNLNHKIAELRKSIPSLRGDASNSTETEGRSAAPKHNKSTILAKAIEYIHHLEQRNAYLENINASLRGHTRNAKSEVIQSGDTVRAESSQSPYAGLEDSPSTTQDSPMTSNDAQGMIPVPDDIKKLRSTAPQEHYAHRISSNDQEPGARLSVRGGKLIGKLMVGSLAGLLVMDGFIGNRGNPENDR